MIEQVTTQEFLSIVDEAIHQAEILQEKLVKANSSSGVLSSSQRALDSLRSIRGHIEDDKLPRVSKGEIRQGAGFGLSRAIGEWTEDEKLLNAVRRVERCFGYNW